MGDDRRVRPVSGGAGERGGGERADRWARGVGGSGHERVGEAGRWAAARGEGECGLGCLRAGFWAGEKGIEEKGWPASGFSGLTRLGSVSGFSRFLSLFFSNTLKLI